MITEERERQISKEGWAPDHDDGHVRGELIDAGLSYIRAAINTKHPAMRTPPTTWPWEAQWWKPSDDRVRNLVKAAALLAAEIDRLNRRGTGIICADCDGSGLAANSEAGLAPEDYPPCETCTGWGVAPATPA